jgi:hypothetical protein
MPKLTAAVDIRAEMLAAAKAGVRHWLGSARGANACRNAKIIETEKGFMVMHGNAPDEFRIYFETMEM